MGPHRRGRRAGFYVTSSPPGRTPPACTTATARPVRNPAFFAEDVRIADVAAELLAERSTDVAFVCFGGVDEVGHQTGPLSASYRQRVKAVDTMVGRLLGAVRGRITYADENCPSW